MIHHASDLTVPVTDQDHSLGPADANVTLVEYGDYECPYCGEAFPIVKSALQELPEIRFVFRNFPLATAHPHAERAAEAAEAAAAQGHFWSMHDLLYSNQDALDDQSLLAYARQIGLDQSAFVQGLEEGRYSSKIRQDFMGGVESGVNGTPYFFINGSRYTGDTSRKSLVEALLQAGSTR